MQKQCETELIDQFMTSAREAISTVERILADAGYLNNALLAAIEDERVLLARPDDLDPELFSIFRVNRNVVTEPTQEQLSTIKIGVTDAFCAIAATGSVCVSSATVSDIS